jgi:hypothetical protein
MSFAASLSRGGGVKPVIVGTIRAVQHGPAGAPDGTSGPFVLFPCKVNWALSRGSAVYDRKQKCLSQTLTRAVGRAGSAPMLHFVNPWEVEAERERLQLSHFGPGMGQFGVC